MARIRTIKPEFPQSESMGRVSRDARLLFIMLWTLVDDHGRFRAAPLLLANLLFPYDLDAKDRIPEWLGELEREKCIRLYEVDGNAYLQIEKWAEHQKIDHPSKPRFPNPPEKLVRPRKSSRDNPKPSSRTKDQGEDQGKEGTDAFEDFWDACPKKVGKLKAKEAFDKVCPSEASAETLTEAMRRYAASVDGKDPTYTAHPTTWLNQKRWTDELPSAGTGPPVLRVVVSDDVAEQERKNLKEMGVI